MQFALLPGISKGTSYTMLLVIKKPSESLLSAQSIPIKLMKDSLSTKSHPKVVLIPIIYTDIR